MLNERYELKEAIGLVPEGLSFEAYDTKENRLVIIKEFYSEDIMEMDDKGNAAPKEGKEVQYKTLLSDFEENAKYKMDFPMEYYLIKPIDFFQSNGSAFEVYNINEMESLESYINRKGKLLFTDMRRMLSSIVAIVDKLHSDNIYHRGICPENIYLDSTGKCWLGGLAITSARTVDSEIFASLYEGYSAPEQYSSGAWQGTWTDVYGLASTCYKVVTGITPLQWQERKEKDTLSKPHSIDKNIPEYISNAIYKGMSVDLSDRYKTIDEFWGDILTDSSGGTIRYNIGKNVINQDKTANAENEKKKKYFPFAVALGIFLLGIISALVISMVFIKDEDLNNIIIEEPNNYQTQTNQEKVESENKKVPNFVGKDIETLLMGNEYHEYNFFIEKEYSEIHKAGIVISQDPLPNETYNEGQDIVIKVSNGTQKAIMPNVIGVEYNRAISMLEESNIQWKLEFVSDIDGKENTVIKSSVLSGLPVLRNTDIITLTIKSNRIPKDIKMSSIEETIEETKTDILQ